MPVSLQRILHHSEGPSVFLFSFQAVPYANLCILELALKPLQGLLKLCVLVGLLNEFAARLDKRVEITLNDADLVNALNKI